MVQIASIQLDLAAPNLAKHYWTQYKNTEVTNVAQQPIYQCCQPIFYEIIIFQIASIILVIAAPNLA